MSMWTPFTEEARQGIVLAQEAAGRFHQSSIGSEHILAGITGTPATAASKILAAVNIEVAAIHQRVETAARRGSGRMPEMVFAPDSKRVIELAFSEARSFHHTYVGTEHLLLGILREGDGNGARILLDLGADLDPIREKVQGAVQMRSPFLAIDHVQLAMPAGRESEARAFYADILGMTENPKPVRLAARGGVWFSSGDVQIHLGIDPDFRAAQKAHPALRCNDYAGLIAKLRAAGVEVQTETSESGVEHAYLNDPFGNRLELLSHGWTRY